MKRTGITFCISLIGLALFGSSAAVAQPPAPLPNAVTSRLPQTSALNLNDNAVDIGLWQEQIGNTLDPKKVFVLGTFRSAGDTQLTLARYDIAGGPAEAIAFWPTVSAGEDPPISLREAKAMTIPVVAPGTLAQNGRIFVVGTTDSGAATTDIVTLAFDFNLTLLWSKTYNYVPKEVQDPWYGDDSGIAIRTDQTDDPLYHTIEYNFVAVLGSSASPTTGQDWVTLAYAKGDGCELMAPKRHTSPGGFTQDTPVDLAVADGLDSTNNVYKTIYVTGGSREPDNAGAFWYYTTGYLIVDPTCLLSQNNGEVAQGWPRLARGVFEFLPAPIPHWTGYASLPARMKSIKNLLVITGTTWPVGPGDGVARSDMLTVAYNLIGGGAAPAWSHQMDFHDNVFGDSREDEAADLDVVYAIGSGEYIAITGTSTGQAPSGKGIASQLYNGTGGQPWGPVGALWTRQAGSGTDSGARLQLVEAFGEANPSGQVSVANVYIAGSSLTSTGLDYVTLKYDSTVELSGGYKALAWDQLVLPYYNNVPSNGGDVPARIAVQYSPPLLNVGQQRRIWVTGTSPDATSGNDWATQFITERK